MRRSLDSLRRTWTGLDANPQFYSLVFTTLPSSPCTRSASSPVAWITERKNTLSIAFYLGSIPPG